MHSVSAICSMFSYVRLKLRCLCNWSKVTILIYEVIIPVPLNTLYISKLLYMITRLKPLGLRRIKYWGKLHVEKKCMGTQHVGSKKYCSYNPYEMFNLQAGMPEKSKSCFRMKKFTTAAPRTEKPRRFTASDSALSVGLHLTIWSTRSSYGGSRLHWKMILSFKLHGITSQGTVVKTAHQFFPPPIRWFAERALRSSEISTVKKDENDGRRN
jgi:hypothetical protein